MRISLLIASTLLFAACASTPPPCPLPDSDVRWIQKALDGWAVVTREDYGMREVPTPWIVMFDQHCTWHLFADGSRLPEARRDRSTALRVNGKPVPLFAQKHGPIIDLPNGGQIPPQIIAAGMYDDQTQKGFFTIAALPVWRENAQASKDPRLEERILSVMIHELTHTQQIGYIAEQLTALREKYPSLPENTNDDSVEAIFSNNPEFAAAWAAGRDALFEAVAETDPARKRELAARALELIDARRARFYVGDKAMYADVESMFLAMEGAAEWGRLQFLKRESPKETEAELIAFMRGRQNSWSQDEGLPLMLLLDELSPNWQARSFGVTPASPIEMLREALRAK